MFSEIQEAVNFIANFLYSKIPRRKVCLFVEQLANFLVLKFQGHWSHEEPLKDSSRRSLVVNGRDQSDSLLSVAASSVGLEIEDILQYLPTDLTIFINPGKVSYRVGEHGAITHLYDAHENVANSTLNKMMAPGSADNRLKLNLNTPAGSNWLISNVKENSTPFFELTTPNDFTFSAGVFAMTRFGTTKQKTNLNALNQIKRHAVVNGYSRMPNIKTPQNMMARSQMMVPPLAHPMQVGKKD